MANIRDAFNNLASNVRGYEESRWFKNDVARSGFEMTQRYVNQIVIKFLGHGDSYLEVGPGPGTWTEYMINNNVSKNYLLVDISSEMIELSKKRFSNLGNIEYVVSDFSDFKTENKFDLFFSSRAVEYVSNKDGFVKKLFGLMNSGSRGVITTKMPHYLRNRIRGKKMSDIHNYQIKPNDFKAIFESNGFRIEGIDCVTINVPFLKSGNVNRLFAKFLGSRRLSLLSSVFAESYAIRFIKP